MDNINWLSLVLATITPMTFGYFYYHEATFGKVWIDSADLKDKKRTKVHKAVTVGVSIILSFFLSLFLLNFNNRGINQEGEFDTFRHGAWHGIFIAITTVSPVIVINGFFCHKSWKKMLIHIFYWIITLALMGGILDVMNHWENIPIPDEY